MYNVKYKRYLNSELLVFYDSLINDSQEKDKRKVVVSTGEICPSNRCVIYDEVWSDISFPPNFTHKGKEYSFDDDMDYMFSYKSASVGISSHSSEEEKIRRSLRRTRQCIYDIAQSNDWEYFFTLTFNPEKVDSFDYDATTKKLSDWLKNMRRCSKKLKYIVVPEQHKSGRWHFHGLFMNCEELGFVDSEKRTDKGQIIYNVGKYKFGFSTAIELDSSKAICTYLTKYITKEMCECSKGKKRYWASRNCNKPIEYKFLVEGGLEEFEKLYNASEFQITSENAYQKVVYNHQPIYTTNTMRFNTSEIEFYPPHIEIIE